MSSIWNNTASGSTVALQTLGATPTPGGSASAKYQRQAANAQQTSEGTGVPSGSVQSQGLASKSPTGLASSTANTTSTSSSAATITGNDFLSLLVTEMQNQDPTSQQDPNEYINQLVQINSLEQLISINQNLGSVLTSSTTPAAPSTSASPEKGFSSTIPAVADGSSRSVSRDARNSSESVQAGNLTTPQPTAASRVVSRSLDGHQGTGRRGHAIRDFPSH